MPGHEVSDLGLIAQNHGIESDRDSFDALQASALKDAPQIRCPSRREDGDADAVSGCHPDGCLELKLNSKVVRMPENPMRRSECVVSRRISTRMPLDSSDIMARPV